MGYREVKHDRLRWGETWQRGHFGPSRTVTVLDKDGMTMATMTLGAGSGDDVTVFTDQEGPSYYYVVSVNDRLPYVGLEVFGPHDDYESSEGATVFLQDWQVDDPSGPLGPRGAGLAPRTILKRLVQYIE